MSLKFLQLIVGIIVIAAAVILLVGCGTIWHARYSNPKFGDAAVEVEIPAKTEGFAK